MQGVLLWKASNLRISDGFTEICRDPGRDCLLKPFVGVVREDNLRFSGHSNVFLWQPSPLCVLDGVPQPEPFSCTAHGLFQLRLGQFQHPRFGLRAELVTVIQAVSASSANSIHEQRVVIVADGLFQTRVDFVTDFRAQLHSLLDLTLPDTNVSSLRNSLGHPPKTLGLHRLPQESLSVSLEQPDFREDLLCLLELLPTHARGVRGSDGCQQIVDEGRLGSGAFQRSLQPQSNALCACLFISSNCFKNILSIVYQLLLKTRTMGAFNGFLQERSSSRRLGFLQTVLCCTSDVVQELLGFLHI
mmetsp:Transcript_124847/g.240845  ORF Transcript_124847/g.240845 Transcript_124847/m.240845 type:complete len:302 (-) Transcript_124847:2-907(-)